MRSLFVFLASLLLISCGDKSKAVNEEDKGPKANEVLSLYQLYTSGNYGAYVDAMQSCDNKPETYRQEMVNALKQHAHHMNQERKGVRKVDFGHAELHNKENMANVFLNVTYGDGNSEEIMIKLVKSKDRWRIR